MANKLRVQAQDPHLGATLVDPKIAKTTSRENAEKLAAEPAPVLPASESIVAAIAHELHEPLTAITNYLEAVRILLDPGTPYQVDKARSAISQAQAQVLRARDLLKRLQRLPS